MLKFIVPGRPLPPPFAPDRSLSQPLEPFPTNWSQYTESLPSETHEFVPAPMRKVLLLPCLTMPLVILSAIDRLFPGGVARFSRPNGPKSLNIHMVGAEGQQELFKGGGAVSFGSLPCEPI